VRRRNSNGASSNCGEGFDLSGGAAGSGAPVWPLNTWATLHVALHADGHVAAAHLNGAALPIAPPPPLAAPYTQPPHCMPLRIEAGTELFVGASGNEDYSDNFCGRISGGNISASDFEFAFAAPELPAGTGGAGTDADGDSDGDTDGDSDDPLAAVALPPPPPPPPPLLRPPPPRCAAATYSVPLLQPLPALPVSAAADAPWGAYLTAANATAAAVEISAWNTALAVAAACEADVLTVDALIAAAYTAVRAAADALTLSYETVRVNTETAELASEATMAPEAAAVSRAAADAAAAVALTAYESQTLTASTAAAAAVRTAADAAAAAVATAATAAAAAVRTAAEAAAAAASTAMTAALVALMAASAVR
jgi:hypothetical protein